MCLIRYAVEGVDVDVGGALHGIGCRVRSALPGMRSARILFGIGARSRGGVVCALLMLHVFRSERRDHRA